MRMINVEVPLRIARGVDPKASSHHTTKSSPPVVDVTWIESMIPPGTKSSYRRGSQLANFAWFQLIGRRVGSTVGVGALSSPGVHKSNSGPDKQARCGT
jgi:hypothetical protein